MTGRVCRRGERRGEERRGEERRGVGYGVDGGVCDSVHLTIRYRKRRVGWKRRRGF
jgi:hypothetical protein